MGTHEHEGQHQDRQPQGRVNYHEEWARRAAEAGYRPAKGRACPRVVAGLRCVAFNRRAMRMQACLCMEGNRDGRGIWDHPRLWREKITGELVVTSEPYSLPGDELAAWMPRVIELGLDVSLYGDSWWNPGRTFRIMVCRDGLASRRWEQSRDAQLPGL